MNKYLIIFLIALFLPQSPLALDILKKATPDVKGFEAMALPDFVATYGMDEWDLSLPALGHFTKYYSSELAIRPFLDKDPEKGMACMMAWAEDKNPKIRRLASEGCRPRLPWAMALPKFKNDPSLILPILEKLNAGGLDLAERKRLAQKAFQHTATCDTGRFLLTNGLLDIEGGLLVRVFTISQAVAFLEGDCYLLGQAFRILSQVL